MSSLVHYLRFIVAGRGLLGSLVAFAALAEGSVFAQSASVTVPDSVSAGAMVEVRWSGPAERADFISIDEAGAPDRSYGTYFYPSRKPSPVIMAAPGDPGRYEVRYHSGASGYKVLAKAPLVVVEPEATLTFPATVESGTSLEVRWQGPNNARDYISIDPEGASPTAYGKYAYTSTGSPVTLDVPDEPGSYQVRYHLGQGNRAIVAMPLVVGDVQASVETASRAEAGSTIAIRWSGPKNPHDYISIDPKGADDRTYGKYTYLDADDSVELDVPDAPGEYQVRYHMAGSQRVIASAPVTVLATNASVQGPSSVAAGAKFDVTWSGPDNRGDWVTITVVGAEDRDFGDYAYTKEGSTLSLEAPFDAGNYELRYMTGQSGQILASADIEVTPGVFPGSVRVTRGGGSVTSKETGAVELVLDASGSMLQRLGSKRRIEVAKEALTSLIGEAIPTGTPFALRVFGHREADSCRTDLELPLAPLDPGRARSAIQSINAMNLAKTPIADSLRAVAQDLGSVEGPVTVVLVTDGEETCDGDPEAAIESLRSAGFDVRVNIVGFAIDQQLLRETFESWARTGGGRYYDAENAEALGRAMDDALELSYELVRGSEVLATGTVNGESVRVTPGEVTVRLLDGDRTVAGTITVEPRGEHGLSID